MKKEQIIQFLQKMLPKLFNEEVSRASKADDDINILVLPSQYITTSASIASVRAWIGTSFKGGRYLERLQMIKEIEKENMK